MAKLSSLVLILSGLLVMPVGAHGTPPPQTSATPASTKQALLTLSGKVTKQGAVLLCSADQKPYHVLNSEMLRHLEGEYVTLKARFLPEKGQLYVTAVRASTLPEDSVKHDDAAFRR